VLAAILRLLRRNAPRTAGGCPCLFDGELLRFRDTRGRESSFYLAEIDEIGIETTDAGPFLEDVYWVLRRKEDAFRVPQGSEVFKQLLERFKQLPGFDWEPFTDAMSCTERRYFPCWRRVASNG
jgi:hypothetical protein